MGETQSAFYEDHEPVPLISSEAPDEVDRYNNAAAFEYPAMVPSTPFFENEQIAEIGDITIVNQDNDVIIQGNNNAKTLFLGLAVFFFIYLVMKSRR